jgi:MFS family permease
MSEKVSHFQHLPHDAEKGNPLVPVITTDPSGIITETGTARLDPSGSALVPTPTTSLLDPLNWPKSQKYACVSIVCYFYFLFTYQCTAPIPSFSLLQSQFNATYTEVNWSFAIPSLGLAVGPLFCSSLADIYGRRIVMIGGTVIALVASGCTSLRGISFSGYMAARFFQGFGASPAATVGLSIINDVSFEHERGFRIGLWVMAIDLGGLCGGFSKYQSFRYCTLLTLSFSWWIHCHYQSVLDCIPRYDPLCRTSGIGVFLPARNALPSGTCHGFREATKSG